MVSSSAVDSTRKKISGRREELDEVRKKAVGILSGNYFHKSLGKDPYFIEGVANRLKELADDKVNLRLSRLVKGESKKMYKMVAGIMAIILLGISALLVSPNVTGYSAFNVEQATANMFGVIFFIAGLISTYFYFRCKKKF